MNDRFKFRVWDIKHQVYVQTSRKHSVYISQEGSCIGKMHTEFGDVIFDYNTSDYIVEQCTGLKDKHGNLIYEGDVIVKSDTNALGYGRIRKCNVHWHNNWLGWAITTEYGDTYAMGEYTSEQYEIIGNIHEHKDAA